jgi:hypothetical protein
MICLWRLSPYGKYGRIPMIRGIIKRMGLYLNTRTVLKFIRDRNMGAIAPGAEALVTNATRLKAPAVTEAIDFGAEEKLLIEPKETGENYVLNIKGRLYLKGPWFFPTGVFKKYSNDNPWLTGLFGGSLGTLLILLLKWVITGNL